MIKLGVNSVLFQGARPGDGDAAHRVGRVRRHRASAIKGMCEHLDLDRWQEQADEIQRAGRRARAGAAEHGSGVAGRGAADQGVRGRRRRSACPSSTSVRAARRTWRRTSQRQTDLMAADGGQGGAATASTLCVKAHVGASIYNTPTTLRAMEKIASPAFGIDMDPSHIYRAGENPAEALPAGARPRAAHPHPRLQGPRAQPGRAARPGLRPRRHRPVGLLQGHGRRAATTGRSAWR